MGVSRSSNHAGRSDRSASLKRSTSRSHHRRAVVAAPLPTDSQLATVERISSNLLEVARRTRVVGSGEASDGSKTAEARGEAGVGVAVGYVREKERPAGFIGEATARVLNAVARVQGSRNLLHARIENLTGPFGGPSEKANADAPRQSGAVHDLHEALSELEAELTSLADHIERLAGL